MKKIIILMPKDTTKGKPSFERVSAFQKFYSEKGVEVIVRDQPSSFKEKIALVHFIYNKRAFNIFISMPQFRNWWLFFMPRLKIILDIRDGWSIAMKSGYGGNVKPSYSKSYLASKIEKIAIKRSALTITCTPGLQIYFNNLAQKDIKLILNGYSDKDKELVENLKKRQNIKINRDEIVAICAGQFSEYGKDKAKLVLNKLSSEFYPKKVTLKLIGSDPEKNNWIIDYIEANNLLNLSVLFLERMDRENMYSQIFNSDIGVTIIRNPDYDFGTKVFDYILCEKPIFNYFDSLNNFTSFFFDEFKEDDLLSFERKERIKYEQKDLMRVLS